MKAYDSDPLCCEGRCMDPTKSNSDAKPMHSAKGTQSSESRARDECVWWYSSRVRAFDWRHEGAAPASFFSMAAPRSWL